MAAAVGPAGLIDTDVLIDAARGVGDAVSFLHLRHASGGLHISIVSAMELVSGCRNGADLRGVRQVLSTLTVHPVNALISQ